MRKLIFFLSIIFLVSRVLHLLFFSLEAPTREELVRGTLAKELIDGLKIPFFDYAADDYHGGSLVYGLCTVPLFLLFGKSLFALRLTGVLFQWATFITWYYFMEHFFGKKPALFTALLYLFSPPWLTLYATYAFGAHAESLLFTALGLFLLYRILYEKGHSQKEAALLGLVSGFGAYFTYGVFISVTSFILFWFYQDLRLLRKKEFFLFVLFFLVGFSPWFVYNSFHHFQGVGRLQGNLAYPYGGRIFIIPFTLLKLATLKILGMLSFDYQEQGHFHPHITFLNGIYYAALLFSYRLLYRFERGNKKTHFFFLFPVLFLSVASMGRFHIRTYEPRYLLPLFPFFFAVIALGLTHLGSGSRRLQRVSVAALVLLLAMGLKGELNLLSPKKFGLALRYQGYSYRELGWALILRHRNDLGGLPNLAKRVSVGLSSPERLNFHLSLCKFLEYQVEKPEELEDVEKRLHWIQEVDTSYQPFYVKEIGYSWGLVEKGILSEKINSAENFLGKEGQPYLMEGLIESVYGSIDGLTPRPISLKPDRMLEYAFGWMGTLSPQNQKALAYSLGRLSWRSSLEDSFLYTMRQRHDIESRLHPKLIGLYYRGVGSLAARLYDPFSEAWPSFVIQPLGGLRAAWQKAIFWGAGFEAPLVFEDPYQLKRMVEATPPEFRIALQQGISDRFGWGGRNLWLER